MFCTILETVTDEVRHMQKLLEKLEILGEAAKFDASCSSSGSGRQGKKGGLGNAHMSGICHTWSADGRCVSLLKVLLSNSCLFDCAYCVNRCSSDVRRATFTPQELARITVEFYKRNYIEGLFLSSAVLRSPDYTMEQMVETMRILREEYRFYGYIHVKVIPSADPLLIQAAGELADRVSVNVELPSSKSLQLLAPNKTPTSLFRPMDQIRRSQTMYLEDKKKSRASPPTFAPAGQTTQMIVGATPDTDLTILRLSKGLYRKYRMKRVYFSAYVPVGVHPSLPGPDQEVPLLREHRLYQADWLMRFYQFDPEELVDERSPQLDPELDPKSMWALRHPEFFPVEVNRADYELLLRIPGVGVKSAQRIVAARREKQLNLEDLRRLGVVMKRAQFFLTASGRFGGLVQPDSPHLRQMLVERRTDGQMSLFDPPREPLIPASLRKPQSLSAPSLVLPEHSSAPIFAGDVV